MTYKIYGMRGGHYGQLETHSASALNIVLNVPHRLGLGHGHGGNLPGCDMQQKPERQVLLSLHHHLSEE
jgi:hypothetical protein